MWVQSPVFLPGKSHGQRSLVGYSSRGWRVRHNWVHMHSTTHSDLKQQKLLFYSLETRGSKIRELAMWQSFWTLKQGIHSLGFPDSIGHLHSLAVAPSSIFKVGAQHPQTSLSLSDLSVSIIMFSLTFQPSSYKDPCDYTGPTWISSFQSLSHAWIFMTPWTAACQAYLSITKSQSLPKLMSIESVMPSNHLILCLPLLLLPPIFPRMSLFKWVSSSYQVAKALVFQLQHQSFQRTPRIDLL